jgi:hypothetical protein
MSIRSTGEQFNHEICMCDDNFSGPTCTIPITPTAPTASTTLWSISFRRNQFLKCRLNISCFLFRKETKSFNEKYFSAVFPMQQ